MRSIVDRPVMVTGGVDTHLEVHVAVVVDEVGRVLGTQDFAADARGYRALLRWMGGFGTLNRVGVEGTGAYGAGLARHLANKAYVERRTKEGKTNKEIIRCLKRYVAREVYKSLVNPRRTIFCPRAA